MKKKVIAVITTLFLIVFLIAGFMISYFSKTILRTILQSRLTNSEEINSIIYQFNSKHISTILIAVFICVLINFIILVLFFNSIFTRVENFKEDLKKVSEGQLAIKLNSDGPLGILAENVNLIVKSTRKILCEIAEVAQKNRDLSSILNKNTEQTQYASEEITRSIIAISESVSKQAENAATTGESTKQMADNAESIATYAKNTENIAQDMMNVIKESGEVFDNITRKIKKTGDVSVKLSGNVEELQNEADEINNIATVVTEISEKTNLLALNAAIEAARAGEHGKGFAVVAEEVRKLAEQSSNSSEKMRELIQNVTLGIKEITKEANLQAESIKDDIRFAEYSKASFIKIEDSTQSTYDAINEIYQLAKQTSLMSDEVNDLVNNIILSTEEEVSFTEEVSAASEEQSASMEEIAGLTTKINKTADNIETKLNEFINNIKIGENEQKTIQSGFEKLKRIETEMNSKEIQIDSASDFLKDQENIYNEFEYIGLINSNGIMKAASKPISEQHNDFSFRPYFKKGIKGEQNYTEPYISNVSFNYCIAIAMPFKDKKGEIKGVIMADLIIQQ